MASTNVTTVETRNISYDCACNANSLLFEVMSLVQSAADVAHNGCSISYAEGMMDEKSHIANLLIQANKKVTEAIKTLNV